MAFTLVSAVLAGSVSVPAAALAGGPPVSIPGAAKPAPKPAPKPPVKKSCPWYKPWC